MSFTGLLEFAYSIIEKLEVFAYAVIDWFQQPIEALGDITLIELLFGSGVALILGFLLVKLIANIVV